MSRPKKKISNPALSMEALLTRTVEAFIEPYDDRDERDASMPSLRSVRLQIPAKRREDSEMSGVVIPK